MCGWLKTSAKQEQFDTLQLHGSGSLFDSHVAVVSAWSIVESALVARSCSTSARVLALLKRGKELTPSEQQTGKETIDRDLERNIQHGGRARETEGAGGRERGAQLENARLLEASAKKRDDDESKRASEAALEAASL